jgi:hypothetical protein
MRFWPSLMDHTGARCQSATVLGARSLASGIARDSMLRRDYILRLIERFGRALIALRDRILKREISSEIVRAEIEDIARDAGADLDVARQLDPAMLVMWLAPTGEIDEGKFWLLAELLFLTALDSRESGTGDRGRADFNRALALLRRLPPDWRPAEGLPTPNERMVEIDRMMA